ncbi:hypothetical protein BDV95DRAFT_581697 [Massariosphaeria phaeospora]|uniref:Uncharacterized protein n=1 Tax=Massariosphaeria phaeospora TaxID=100035 RepID=A0A7C8M256_9PLEO|nr:hypothetical protein BDV95DRAFT_581697 [Massariosphaeria phaeospora]
MQVCNVGTRKRLIPPTHPTTNRVLEETLQCETGIRPTHAGPLRHPNCASSTEPRTKDLPNCNQIPPRAYPH